MFTDGWTDRQTTDTRLIAVSPESFGRGIKMFRKKNQRSKTPKLRKGEQSFLYMTQHSYLIHTPINLYEDILYSKLTELWGLQECLQTNGIADE